MPSHNLALVKNELQLAQEDGDSFYSQCYVPSQQANSLEELVPLAPAGPAATPVCVKQERVDSPPALQLETLESVPQRTSCTLIERHLSSLHGEARERPEASDFTPLLAVKDEPLSEGEQHQQSGEDTSDSQAEPATRGSPKSWTPTDMDNALEALRSHHMSLTKASALFGIPSTTLWQRAHRLGIDTPKKEGSSKSWSETDLKNALEALRAGSISANKASKAYGIPSSTLYKIARREGIRLAAPFNAAPTAWRRTDLRHALGALRARALSVQRAAALYGIPTGTLYGRCKREGIELSRSNPTPWSEDAMAEALEAVRVGQMSINQAAIHYNLPYSSLYGRFKRCKYQSVQQYQQPPIAPDGPPHDPGPPRPAPHPPAYPHYPHAHEQDYAQTLCYHHHYNTVIS
ncbi:uncharacterized protein LOC101739964 isoform X1 [Bombyx mori]|uniref:HTH psq-type domain-containing protein n=1 Tax=Bombyx mori TaxID=7091 RepID=A0A8R2LZ45_BOMMO|nr:uncharacterized protein LOC101739964 isoform X1 [Bombyx mori]XP_037869704.1 uncharacterized protein LOC101739964 isoform X1 [Bombyx mori]